MAKDELRKRKQDQRGMRPIGPGNGQRKIPSSGFRVPSSAIRILLVEDNPGDVRLIKEVLGGKRYRIITAETGEDGLKKAKAEKPDLIIIDTLLPGIHGFEVCRRIRKNQGRTTPKIIITTGVIDAIDAIKARRMGADDYCVKTSDCLPLLDAIERIF